MNRLLHDAETIETCTTEESFWKWAAGCFALLPHGSDEAFVNLWGKRRLEFLDGGEPPDRIDEWSAALVCASLHKHECILIVLPDHSLRRAPLLLATALITYALDCMQQKRPGGHVVYFGSTVGIRGYLSRTRVGDLVLASVFPQEHACARGHVRMSPNPPKQTVAEHLPRVICVYSPVDPLAVLKQYPAAWLAIDCGDEAKLAWLPSLLKYAREYRLPVVAWAQNGMSESVADFRRVGAKIFRWPKVPLGLQGWPFDEQQPGKVPGHDTVTQVSPVLIHGPEIERFTRPLQQAYHLLARAATSSLGRMGHDALRLGWRYLRALESLPVPLDLYEAEVQHVWGLKPIHQLASGLRRFANVIQSLDPCLASALEEIEYHLSDGLEQLKSEEPPLWLALTDLCVSDVPEGLWRVLVFPNVASRRLFSFALLARYNITEDDLVELRVALRSLPDLRRELGGQRADIGQPTASFRATLPTDLPLQPLLVGLPGPWLAAYLEPVLLQARVGVVVYPYQEPALARRVEQWNAALAPDPEENAATLSDLSGCRRPASLPRSPVRVRLAAATPIAVSRKQVMRTKDGRMVQQLGDPVDEVMQLFEAEGDVDCGHDGPLIPASGVPGESEDEGRLWVEQAVKVQFDGGWEVLFAPDAQVNVVVQGPGGDRTDERCVGSLRTNDRVLFIHGQQRQSLYELIISRVHRHASIELHLALIRRWQEDFATAYQRWRQGGVRSLEELLRLLQSRGSRLTSPVTLRLWLQGRTLCPDDEQDLRRLAEVLDLAFVRQYYHRIYQAANRLRGLHRGVASRLNRWLREQAVGQRIANDDEIIDVELGLTFGDFRSSLLILRVAATQRVPGPFTRATLGRLERRASDE